MSLGFVAVVVLATIAAGPTPPENPEVRAIQTISERRETNIERVHIGFGDPTDLFVGTPAWNAAEATCRKQGKLVGVRYYRRFAIWHAHYWCVPG